MSRGADVKTERAALTLGDVGFIGALLSVLAFQSLRLDPFESEKLGLLLLCSVLMLVELFPASWAVFQRWRSNRVIIAVIALALVTLFSSLLALSPARALVGSGFRSYGWIVIACETILVLYVAASGARLRNLIPPLLALLTVPLCLYAMYQVFSVPSPLRPGSTTGNPNYLAAWLGLCLMWILPSVLTPRKGVSPRGSWLLIGLWTVLVLYTLNLTGSRAAFIGLLVSGAAGLILWAAFRRSLIAIFGIIGVGMAVIGLLMMGQGRATTQQGFARLLEPVDDFRQAAWTDGLSMAQEMTVPLMNHAQMPDTWAGLRPVLGYGLDNLDTLRARIDQLQYVTALTLIVDRMHSLLYDTLLSTGVLGLIMQALVFEAVWLSLLRAAHLLTSRRNVLICVIFQGVGCVGVGLIGRLLGWTLGVSLALSLLGLVIGLLVWLALTTWRSRSTPPQPVSRWLMGLWCGSIFYFVCHLFGFQQIVSGILFAALVGFCALEPSDEAVPAPKIDPLFLVLVVVTVFASSLLRAVTPLPLVIMICLLIGSCAAALWIGRVTFSWQHATLYGGGLAVLMLGVQAARGSLSTAMNQTLLAAPSSSLTDLMLPTGGHALLTLLCYACAGLLIWKAGQPRWIAVNRRRLGFVIAGLIGVGLVFVVSSTGHVLWKTATALDSVTGAQYAAEMSYQGAEELLPWTIEPRLAHLRFLQTSPGQSLGIDDLSLVQALNTLDPFNNNRIKVTE